MKEGKSQSRVFVQRDERMKTRLTSILLLLLLLNNRFLLLPWRRRFGHLDFHRSVVLRHLDLVLVLILVLDMLGALRVESRLGLRSRLLRSRCFLLLVVIVLEDSWPSSLGSSVRGSGERRRSSTSSSGRGLSSFVLGSGVGDLLLGSFSDLRVFGHSGVELIKAEGVGVSFQREKEGRREGGRK